MEAKKKIGKKWMISFLLYLLALLIIGCTLINTVSAQGITAKETCDVDPDIVFCSCDMDCLGKNEICITEITPDNVREMCSAYSTKINLAKRYENKMGFCAVIASKVTFPDGTSSGISFVDEGTVYCPKKEEEEETTADMLIAKSNLEIPSIINSSSSLNGTKLVEGTGCVSPQKNNTLTFVALFCVVLFFSTSLFLLIKLLKTHSRLKKMNILIGTVYGGESELKRRLKKRI